MLSEENEREIEIGIVRAFGWAVIEFEAVLFQKFLVMSARSSLMSIDMFRKHLMSMEAKGFVAPVDFQNKRAWKRLVIESDIEEESLNPEEVRAFIQKALDSQKKSQTLNMPKGESVVSECKALAEEILQYLERGMPSRIKNKPYIGEPTLINHVEAMHHALAGSREDFLKYVRKYLPRIHEDMERLLSSKGEDIILRSLRVIESGRRTYPPQ